MFNIDLNKSFTFLYFNRRIFVRLMGISNLNNLKITQLKLENSWQREEEYNCIFISKKKKDFVPSHTEDSDQKIKKTSLDLEIIRCLSSMKIMKYP